MAFGDAGSFGSPSGLAHPIVGIAPRAGNDGYWLTGSNGGVFAYGAATYLGGANQYNPAHPIVGIATRPQSDGYWQVGADGGIFAFGLPFYGSLPGLGVSVNNIASMAARPSGDGYWFIDSEGAVFAFGSATFYGGVNTIPGHIDPVVSITPTTSGNGYWLVDSKGAVFAFGDATYFGGTNGISLNQPVKGLARTPSSNGYWLYAGDGGTFSFQGAPFCGNSLDASPAIRASAATHWTTSPTAAPAVNALPAGQVDAAASGQVAGWSYDPNTASASLQTHVYIDGVGYNLGATAASRPDVNSAFRITGVHGFSWVPPAQWSDGNSHTIHVYAIDSSGGPNPLVYSGTFSETNYTPFGTLDEGNGGTIRGWAFDANDEAASLNVQIVIDGSVAATIPANEFRGDISFVGYHGFNWPVPVQYKDQASHSVSVYALNLPSGPSTLLGSFTFQAFGADWTGSNGAGWGAKWFTSSSSKVTIQGNRGEIKVTSASERATANMTPRQDTDVRMKYQFSPDRNAGSEFRVAVRGTGNSSPSTQVTTAYRMVIPSDGSTIKIQRISSGSVSTLATFTYTPDLNVHSLRFQVTGDGSVGNPVTIRAKLWSGTSEPSSWNSVTDTTSNKITGSGVVQLAHSYSSGTPRSVFVDDLTAGTP